MSAPSGDSIEFGSRPRRICYVDDSRTSAYVTKKILAEFGYDVDHFPSAEPAIVALLEGDYDLLLTDLVLATGGMDGDDLVRFLRMSGHPRKKLLPVIVITGSSDKDTLLKIYEAGANGVLVKPITGEELNDRIRSLLPDKSPHASDSGLALEIHDEPVTVAPRQADEPPSKPSARAPAAPVADKKPKAQKARKEPPAAENRTETTPIESSPEMSSVPDVDNAKPESVLLISDDGVVEESPQQPPAAPPKRPITAFGAKKREQKDAEPVRDAAAVIAELRARDEEDEDIPTLTLALESPFQDAPSETIDSIHGHEQHNRAFASGPDEARFDDEHATAEHRDDREEHFEVEDDVSLFNAVEMSIAAEEAAEMRATSRTSRPKAREARAPKREAPVEPKDMPSDSKAIITALDIEQDFKDIQDDFYQPSITSTVVETIKRYKILSASAAASLLIIVWSLFNFMSSGSTVPVDIVRAEFGSLHQSIAVPGKVVSKLKVDVSANSSGQVKQILVREGDKVRKGESLAVIDNDELSSEVKRAEGNFLAAQEEAALAEKTVTRMRRALELGAVSRQAVEEAEAALRSAKAKESVAKESLRSTRSLADKLTVTAPFDGTVTAKQIQVGQYVKTSEPLFSIVDLGQREVEVKVDAADSSSISVGQDVDISTDAFPGRRWTERVLRVAPAANRETTANTVNVNISLGSNAPPMKIGQQVDAEIRIVSSDRATKLPIGALIQRNGKSWVALVEDGRVHFVSVGTGMEDLTHVEILQGIRPGQEVVMPKGATLREGDRVTVASGFRQE